MAMMRLPRTIIPQFLLLLPLFLQTFQQSDGLKTPLHIVDEVNVKFREFKPELVREDAESTEYSTSTASPATTTSETTTSDAPETDPSTSVQSTEEATTEPPTEPPTDPSTSEKPSTRSPTTTTPEPTTTTAVPVRVPRVTVDALGTAVGTTLTSFQGKEFYAFMSIPYAKAPEGDLRFDYPKPFEGRWPEETEDSEYEATFLRARCVQESLILPVVTGKEDCLHLSIYSPLFPESTNRLPVMVWFHGGAYMTGDAHLYVPTKLMDRDVMVVVVQYRLGSLGFLAGNMIDNPGNMGLMDQIMALRWVQDYIENFGGDNDRVTVFGQSAGGASSSWLQLTPLTNGSAPANKGRDLIHGTIPQSGSALEVWTLDRNPEDSFLLTAATLSCNDTDDKVAMLSCMRDKDYTEVYTASASIYVADRLIGGLGFRALCPVIQDALIEEEIEIVIPRDPLEIISSGEFMKVPMMAGTVRDEGSLVVGLSYKDYMKPNHFYVNDTDFVKYQAVQALIGAFGLPDHNSAVYNSMKVAYFPNADLGNWTDLVGGMIDLTGVMFLKSGLWSKVSHLNRVDPDLPIYFYSWEFESDDSLFPWIFISTPELPVPGGVAHADELLYLFHLPSYQDERQQIMTDRMITLWSNFAKYGDPTPDEVSDSWIDKVPKWERYSNDDYKFMLMSDDFEMAQDFTSRWHHHREQEPVSEDHSRSEVLQTLDGEREEGKPVSQMIQTEAGPDGANNKITIGIFEGFLVLVVVSGCIFGIVYRQKLRHRNRIV